MSKTDTEEKTLLNKVVIFVFFAHKKHSHFITLQLNQMSHGIFKKCIIFLSKYLHQQHVKSGGSFHFVFDV